VYEIAGRIYEQHGEYKAYLEAWSTDGQSKVLLFNEYADRLTFSELPEAEHVLILELLDQVCRRIAQRMDRALF
jgi:hypothetical protein